jgi:hypothetical protein
MSQGRLPAPAAGRNACVHVQHSETLRKPREFARRRRAIIPMTIRPEAQVFRCLNICVLSSNSWRRYLFFGAKLADPKNFRQSVLWRRFHDSERRRRICHEFGSCMIDRSSTTWPCNSSRSAEAFQLTSSRSAGRGWAVSVSNKSQIELHERVEKESELNKA